MTLHTCCFSSSLCWLSLCVRVRLWWLAALLCVWLAVQEMAEVERQERQEEQALASARTLLAQHSSGGGASAPGD